MIALKRVDFPTFGRPTITTDGSTARSFSITPDETSQPRRETIGLNMLQTEVLDYTYDHSGTGRRCVQEVLNGDCGRFIDQDVFEHRPDFVTGYVRAEVRLAELSAHDYLAILKQTVRIISAKAFDGLR